MEEELVSLKWNNHLTVISQLLYSLREEVNFFWIIYICSLFNELLYIFQEQLVDVTLACDGKLYSAHKLVLCMCSDYFKEMFVTNPCQHPIGN